MRILLFLLAALAIYLLFRQKRPTRRSAKPAPPSPEVMVSCAHCGLHIPQSESLEAGGRYYCSEEHKRLSAGLAGK